jgi:hypothetical protein
VNWAAFALALARGFLSLMSFLQERQLINLGQAQAVAALFAEWSRDLRLAQEARAGVKSDPGGVQHDPFNRDG